MFDTLPKTFDAVKSWTIAEIEPYYQVLLNCEIGPDNIEQWLTDWTALENIIGEIFSRARVATTQDTADNAAEARLKHLLATVYPKVTQAANEMNKKLLQSGLTPDGLELPLKKMRTEVALFREANIPLSTKEQELGLEYAKITGAQTVQWQGEEVTLLQLNKALQDRDRPVREQAWRLMMGRWLQDRTAINTIWSQLFHNRAEMARNAGFDNYRDFRWQQFHRYDYTPQDCETFHHAIETVVIPAVRKRNERRRERLGLERLRPWDLAVDPEGREIIRPYETIDEFAAKAEAIFNHVDPQLGAYYAIMRQEDLLDLPNRKGKSPGAYCTGYPLTQRPFVFMNAVGTREDVRTLLHEIGHAFHNFETLAQLPYRQQRDYPIEYAEVASMAMELLAAPYLNHANGGYFTDQEAARDRIEHLEKILFFWPYMAVVDSFQHWAYGGGDAAADPAACDQKWAELWDRFMVAADYTGLEDIKMTGWHRKQHIYRYPFYYVEYGLAQLGAVQVWANARHDQAEAVKAYRRGLALGGTKNLHELYAATGVKFAFDAETMAHATKLIEQTIDQLEAQLA
ncbi:MAG: M3 family oligoendopeptidase [Anaerolineae bacterium]|nr:M3 family oligoendopeptidase [Anaerolineae bacterium]